MSPKAITFGAETTGDYSKAREKEWLITNELGGYASSTITGANTRGYHGLLVASLGSSLQRKLLLSKLEEVAIVKGERYPLSVNKYPGVLHPDGYKYLKEFQLDPNPHFLYTVGTATIRKIIHMPPKTNCTITSYEANVPEGVEIEVRPLVSNRGFHERLREDSGIVFTQKPSWRGLTIESSNDPHKLYLQSNLGGYEPSETWYKNMVYDEETDRGLEDREDLYSPGAFKARLNDREIYRIIASAEATQIADTQVRQHNSNTGLFSLREWLIHSSGQFLAYLPDGDCTIIAGYHWFGEWGRDSAISLPGLLLVTQRFEEAKRVLRRFLAQTRDGLAPNLRGEDGEPNYASIDASLWLIYATYKYYTYTEDIEFLADVYPKLKDILNSYRSGNSCLRVAENGLLESTVEGSSLTWMDARVNGVSVTPRVGKCVEVNALYYNALRSLEVLSQRLNEPSDPYRHLANAVKRAFNDVFWYHEGGYLYDYIGKNIQDASIRPNQITSISLPFPVLEKSKWGSVYKVIERNLLTPYGLRTLAPSDPKYRGRCVGSPRDRDLSYHNGTVWAWLIGPYLTAHTRLGFSSDTLLVRHILNSFKQHLYDAGLGNISEIFDGDPPHKPRGCIAQAWSVGELLRVYHEDLKESKLKTI